MANQGGSVFSINKSVNGNYTSSTPYPTTPNVTVNPVLEQSNNNYTNSFDVNAQSIGASIQNGINDNYNNNSEILSPSNQRDVTFDTDSYLKVSGHNGMPSNVEMNIYGNSQSVDSVAATSATSTGHNGMPTNVEASFTGSSINNTSTANTGHNGMPSNVESAAFGSAGSSIDTTGANTANSNSNSTPYHYTQTQQFLDSLNGLDNNNSNSNSMNTDNASNNNSSINLGSDYQMNDRTYSGNYASYNPNDDSNSYTEYQTSNNSNTQSNNTQTSSPSNQQTSNATQTTSGSPSVQTSGSGGGSHSGGGGGGASSSSPSAAFSGGTGGGAFSGGTGGSGYSGGTGGSGYSGGSGGSTGGSTGGSQNGSMSGLGQEAASAMGAGLSSFGEGTGQEASAYGANNAATNPNNNDQYQNNNASEQFDADQLREEQLAKRKRDGEGPQGEYSEQLNSKAKASEDVKASNGKLTGDNQRYKVVPDSEFTGADGTISQSDYDLLKAVIAGEGANDMDDMLGVAGTLFNRLENKNFGKNMTDVLEKGYFPWGRSYKNYVEGGKYYNQDWGQQKLAKAETVLNDVLNGYRNIDSNVYYYSGDGQHNYFSDRV